MTTTALAVEYVVVGFQVLVWLSLLVGLVFGYHWVHLSALKEWHILLTGTVFAVSYTVGVVFDSLAGALHLPLARKLSQLYERDNTTFRRVGQTLLMYPDLAKRLDTMQMRIRLLRSTSVNLLLIFAFGLPLLLRSVALSAGQIALLVCGPLVLILLAFSAWSNTHVLYLVELNLAAEAAPQEEEVQENRGT